MAEKYIPLSAAIKAIHEEFDEALVWDESGEKTADVIEEILLDIEPADVQSVVLCRNCENSKPWYSDKRLCYLWSESGVDVFSDGFCYYGKRRGGSMRPEPPERIANE